MIQIFVFFSKHDKNAIIFFVFVLNMREKLLESSCMHTNKI
jgi:hypothetical protein